MAKGFANMTAEERKKWGSVGGKRKVKKGFAKMNKERLKEVSSKGGTTKWASHKTEDLAYEEMEQKGEWHGEV